MITNKPIITDEFNITFNGEHHPMYNQEFVFLDLEDTNGSEYKFYKKINENSWTFNEPEDNKYFEVNEKYIINEYPNGLLFSIEIKKESENV